MGPDPHCLIIADDLTGACDAAGPFAARGYETRAALHPAAPEIESAVVAISTDTRDAPPGLLREALTVISQRPGRPAVLFKKIDSTLRGNAPAEIDAALDIFGCASAVITPAFPAMRRIVTAGCLSIVDDPKFAPIHLASHFRSVHTEPSGVAAALQAGRRIITVEACTDADLDIIAAAGLASPGPVLWAGSSGLGSAIARSLPVRPAPSPLRTAGAVIFCVGSEHPITTAQQSNFCTDRGVQIIDALTCPPDAVAAAVHPGHSLVLRLLRGLVPELRVAQLLTPIRQSAAALMVTGGDTASLLCRALDVGSIALYGEITPGIPYGRIEGGLFDACPIVTKSGGFGRPDAFIEIADFFACPQQT